METSQMEGGLDNTILHLDTCIEFGNKSIVFPAHSLQVFNNQIQVFCWKTKVFPLAAVRHLMSWKLRRGL